MPRKCRKPTPPFIAWHLVLCEAWNEFVVEFEAEKMDWDETVDAQIDAENRLAEMMLDRLNLEYPGLNAAGVG
jgi:hypothetical protein